MGAYRYLIVGGGMTGDAACRGIRDHDTDGTIGVVGAEAHEPYKRPPLSKALWKRQRRTRSGAARPSSASTFTPGGAIVVARPRGADGDRRHGASHTLREAAARDRGAAEAAARGCDDVVYFRTLDDYRQLRDLAGDGVRVAVIGGGFIGSEIAAALAMNGCEVTIVFPERRRSAHGSSRPSSRPSSTTTTASKGVDGARGRDRRGDRRRHA